MPDRAKTLTTTIAIVACLVFAPLAVEAQQGGKVYRNGLLHSSSSVVALFTGAFRQGMRERDYIEGKNYVLEIRARESKTDQLRERRAISVA